MTFAAEKAVGLPGDNPLLDRLPLAVLIAAFDGRVLEANALLLEWTGLQPQALRGMRLSELLADPSAHARLIEPALRMGSGLLQQRLDLRTAAGTVFPALLYAATLPSADAVERSYVLCFASAARWLKFDQDQTQALVRSHAVSEALERAGAELVCEHQALKNSAQQWKYTLQASGEGEWDWDLVTGEQSHSLSWKEMLGYSEQEIGNGYNEFVSRVHPDDLAAVTAAAGAYLRGETPSYAADLRMRCKDGSWKWILARDMVVSRDTQGRPTRMIGTHTDITDRKTTETELRDLYRQLGEKTALLQTTLGSISQGIFMIGMDGRVSTYNARVCELLDVPASYLDTRPTLPEITIFQTRRGDFGPEAALVSANARAYVAAAGQAEIPPHYLRTTKDGRTLEVRTQTLPGAGMVRTFTDVTDYVQAEQARARLTLLLEATQAMAQVGGWEVDVVQDRVYWTAEVYRMLDTSPQEYTPTTASTMHFFAPESAPLVQAAIRDAVADGKTHDLELEMITAKGRRIWVHSKSTVQMEHGQVLKRTSVLQDITERKRSEEALRAGEELFRQITSQMPGMVYRLHVGCDGSRSYKFVSDGVRELYGVEPEAVLADGRLLHAFRHPDDQQRLDTEVADHTQRGLPLSIEFRIIAANGSMKWVHLTSAPASFDKFGFIRNGVMVDITARKLAEDALRESEERWKLALDSTGDGVWDWHLQTGVEKFSKRFIEMYGYTEDELHDRAEDLDRRTHPDDLEQMQRDRKAHLCGLTPTYVNEHRVLCKDGSWKWVLTRGMVVTRDSEGRPLRMIGTHTDISNRKKSEALIWQQANFDTLTGLPNRRMLRDRLEHDLRKADRESRQLAILFIDLDHFKEVNDTLGHDRGDQLLIEAARRIRSCVRNSDTVARMGGDEFTVVLTELSGAGQLERILADLLHAVATLFQLGNEQVFISASIGITMYPGDATGVEDLFKNADQALYVAKGAGRNRFSFFTPALQEAAQNRVRLANDLRSGLAEHQFRLVYQPIVELSSAAIHKAEALIRWQHPSRGLVSPADFIPIAESSGLIIEIGEWVFQQAVEQVGKWRQSLHPQFQISVNRSPVQFHASVHSQGAWVAYLESQGLPGGSLAVEITEGLLLDTSAGVTDQLLALRDAGIQVSLDDFGTGYSSLTYLQKFDIDYIKIDQSFVRNLSSTSTDLALCKAIIVMAHELGMKVIAEGVETSQQRDLLVAAGCDYGQGYLFARPMPASEFEALYAPGITIGPD